MEAIEAIVNMSEKARETLEMMLQIVAVPVVSVPAEAAAKLLRVCSLKRTILQVRNHYNDVDPQPVVSFLIWSSMHRTLLCKMALNFYFMIADEAKTASL